MQTCKRPRAASISSNFCLRLLAATCRSGLTGLVVAGLLAAFMSTFDLDRQRRVGLHCQRYLQAVPVPRSHGQAAHLHELRDFDFCDLAGNYFWVPDRVDSHSDRFLLCRLCLVLTRHPHVLKWHWWRFNSYGFFAGMVSGLVAALAFTGIDKLYVSSPETFEKLGPGISSLAKTISDLTSLEAFFSVYYRY